MHKIFTFFEKQPRALVEKQPRALVEKQPRALVEKQPRALVLLTSLCFCLPAQAHTPLFDCFDNGDATITCEGGFSDGASAAGVVIRVLDAQGKVLEQGELGADGSISLARPEGEFSVVFFASAEHSITVLGDDII